MSTLSALTKQRIDADGFAVVPGALRQRPARLYRFAAARFAKLKDKGVLFPF
jgi:hypothetical protein